MPREADVPYFNFRKGHSETWRAATVCGPVGTKHPWTATGPGSRAALNVGRRICNELCPVREQCLAYAISADINFGTWGGLTEAERRKLSELDRRRIVGQARMTLYTDERGDPRKECQMVVVIAKAKFLPTLAVGEVGEVEDTLARAAIRNGYAELVGNPLNFDDWMYHGADLVIEGRTAAAAKKVAQKGKPRSKMVDEGTTLETA